MKFVYEDARVVDLRSVCKERGLITAGKKNELIARLREYDQQKEEEEIEGEQEGSVESQEPQQTPSKKKFVYKIVQSPGGMLGDQHTLGDDDISADAGGSVGRGTYSTEHTAVTAVGADGKVQMFYGLALVCLLGILTLLYNRPDIENEHCDKLAEGGLVGLWKGIRAQNLEFLGHAHSCADAYKQENLKYIISVYAAMYIGMQTFAIPGTIVLSLLSGLLFGFWQGQVAIIICATSGSSLCFLLSNYFGRSILSFFKMDDKLETFRKEVNESKFLLGYIFLSRLLPVPNVLVNFGSPLVGVDLATFAVGTLFGLMPYNFFHVSTGLAVKTFASDSEQFNQFKKENSEKIMYIGGMVTVFTLLLLITRYRKRAGGKSD